MKAKMVIISLMAFLMSSCSPSQIVYSKSSMTKKDSIDDSYKRSHTFDDCARPIGFSRNTFDKAWVYTGKEWKLSKLNIKQFNEINDSLLIHADYNAMFKEIGMDGRPLKNMNITKGDFIVARHISRVNNYYVFKFVDQIDEKVKLDKMTYRIKSQSFYNLEKVEQLGYCLLQSDLETLAELVTSGQDLDVCAKFENIEISPLTLSITKYDRKLFNKLIELGADIDYQCRGKRTALMEASDQNDTYYFEQLIILGANQELKDERNKTVHDYIKHNGNLDLLELLRK